MKFFYITETLASLEGLEKGPAGNTALAAAFSLAQEMDNDQIIVVQETEYTGAGKHIQPQLAFARDNGIDIKFGNPKEEIAGINIILPENPGMIKAVDHDMNKLRKSLIKNALANYPDAKLDDSDIDFLVKETKSDTEFVKATIKEIKG